MSHKSQINHDQTISLKSFLCFIWLVLVTQTIYSNLIQLTEDSLRAKDGNFAPDMDIKPKASASFWHPRPIVLLAEAGKKKKEKSEVVVISVNNPKGMGHMYPVYVPSCGHSGGFGRR